MLAAVLVSLFISHSAADQTLKNSQKIARIRYTDTPPKIDGKVDKVWLTAHEQNGFIQREPHQGKLSTNDTKFFLLYDKNNIYLLFVMLDDQVVSIPARLVERDYQFYPDDSINFLLDTFNDNRKAFYFSTNPLGVEQDGLISENGENMDLSWDGIYNVAAKINKYGWTAEFAIPFKTLRFSENSIKQIWGFNAFRIRKKSREISYWSLVSQDYQLFRLDHSGHLVGLKNIESGQHLNFLPYVTTRHIDSQSDDSELDFNSGIDIKYGISSDLTLDLTVNPDFGQVEIDEEQINLDKRFEVQLDEKRPFFLENTNLFQNPFYQLFYSRRIGAQSDIKAGAKLTGKIGDYSVGLLESFTGDWENYGLGEPDTLATDELFSALRIQKDILKSSNLGFTYVDREADLRGDKYRYNRAGGIDWSVYSGQNYFLGQLVHSSNSYLSDNDSKIKERGGAAFGQIGRYGRLFWIDLNVQYYEPDFDIDSTGFFQKLPNKGKKQISVYSEIHPLINKKVLRSWGLSVSPTVIRDSDESELAWGIKSSLWLIAPDESQIKIGFTRYFDVETNFLLPTDELTYWGRDIYTEINTDLGKPISLYLRGNFDSQYYFQTHSTGFNKGLESKIRMKPLSNIYFEFGYKRTQFLDENLKLMPIATIGQSDVQILTFRSRYLLKKNIFSRGFIQFTNGAEQRRWILDPATNSYQLVYDVWDRISGNVLFGWRFKPGSTLYLAYTEEFDKFDGKSFKSTNRIIFFKFSYYWSF